MDDRARLAVHLVALISILMAPRPGRVQSCATHISWRRRRSAILRLTRWRILRLRWSRLDAHPCVLALVRGRGFSGAQGILAQIRPWPQRKRSPPFLEWQVAFGFTNQKVQDSGGVDGQSCLRDGPRSLPQRVAEQPAQRTAYPRRHARGKPFVFATPCAQARRQARAHNHARREHNRAFWLSRKTLVPMASGAFQPGLDPGSSGKGRIHMRCLCV